MNKTPNPQLETYTFNQWKDLAKNDPDKFESERKKVLDAYVANTPEKGRLKIQQILFRVDGMRRKFRGSGLVSAQQAYRLMLDSVSEFISVLPRTTPGPIIPKPTLVLVPDKKKPNDYSEG